MKKQRILIALATLLIILFCSSFFNNFINQTEEVTIDKREYERLKQFEELMSVYKVIDERYYIEPDYAKLKEGAVRGMLNGLDDDYSIYYNPKEFEEYWENDEGQYAGIGVQIQRNFEEKVCRITRVFKNSPAEEMGIKKGDLLIKAGEIEVTPESLDEAVKYIRGEIGTKADIVLLRGEEEIPLAVERRQIQINLIESTMLDNKIGIIQLFEFSGESGKEFAAEYNALKDKGMQGLILDLRDNPGGWVENARGIADLFIENDTLCYFEYRDGSREYIKTGPGKTSIPMVVLINENSASASELLSGCFRDYGLADIVGVTSFGKGIAQEVLPVGDNGAGFQFTVAQYFTPKGVAVHKKGITPDYVVELNEEDKNIDYDLGDLDDKQLAKAYEVIQTKLK